MPHEASRRTPIPPSTERRRCNARRTVTIPRYMQDQAQEITEINDTKPGVILREAIRTGLPPVRAGEPAERERRGRNRR